MKHTIAKIALCAALPFIMVGCGDDDTKEPKAGTSILAKKDPALEFAQQVVADWNAGDLEKLFSESCKKTQQFYQQLKDIDMQDDNIARMTSNDLGISIADVKKLEPYEYLQIGSLIGVPVKSVELTKFDSSEKNGTMTLNVDFNLLPSMSARKGGIKTAYIYKIDNQWCWSRDK